jgi:CRISPR-associated endonuclease/helicase Cas3
MYAASADGEVTDNDPPATDGAADPSERPLLAKSGRSSRVRHERRSFRHELASALALFGDARSLLEGTVEKELVCYLVAAHHGRFRMAIRPFPNEQIPPTNAEGESEDISSSIQRRFAGGVWEGDVIPEFEFGGHVMPATSLSLLPMEISGDDEGRSWAAMATSLVDRADLGPFRLGFLEAVVRAADWRISAGYVAEEIK